MKMRKLSAVIPLTCLLLLCAGCLAGAAAPKQTATSAPASPPKPAASVLAAADFSDSGFDGSIILGRPEPNSVTAAVSADVPCDVYLEWGSSSNSYTNKSVTSHVTALSPAMIVMDGLQPDSRYYYRLSYKADSGGTYRKANEASFQTPRAAGSSYSFVIQSDSHLMNKADPTLYKQSMQNMAALKPDFMFDMGDTFLNDQVKNFRTMSYDDIAAISKQQLPYFSIVAQSAPLFLTIGNHEGEYGAYLDGTTNNVAAKSTIARTTFYPNPVPDSFYSGNAQSEKGLGLPENYYAFTWGDALYVSIDPYRYTATSPDAIKDGWEWTLGKVQYDWLKKTLESSTAKYKFIFCHHIIGNMRGGAEISKLFEWGGYDNKGKYLFDEKRPGWGKPIAQLLKEANVTVVFQGHDHLFARETVDGIVYQTLPKPAEKIPDQQSNFDAYPDGDVLLNSGFLNVTVTPDNVRIDYNRNYFVSSAPQDGNTGVVYSYTVDASHKVTVLKDTKDDTSTYGGTTGNEKPKGNKKDTAASSSSSAATPSDSIAPVATGGFSFAIQADSHLDENTDVNLYKQTLANVVGAKPDFLMDLGDTFMSEKTSKTSTVVNARYVEAKSYFSLLGTLPLYLVNGNHDGENGWDQALLSLARADRQKYFPFTTPAGFSGNVSTANYYAFINGDAQFIILDPFTFTVKKASGSSDGWNYTLGKTQYDWLKTTLAASTAKYKFVFIHNLVGGYSRDARGGAEAANFFEWGGYNSDGTYGFDSMRPGWGQPIQQLLKEHGVTAVFHGHDHFYDKQELDGIVYQLVPQPGTPGNSVNSASDYSYSSGTILPSAGYLRVVVSDNGVTVEYVKTNTSNSSKMEIADSYTIK